MQTILVTGGSGFIGSHTCLYLLENDYNVVIVDSNINSSPVAIERVKEILLKKNKNIENSLLFFKGDIRNEKFLDETFSKSSKLGKPISAVIHFAGLKAVKESVINPLNYWDTNVKGTISLLRVMEKYNCKTIVFSSSATIYGDSSSNLISESEEIKPKNPYGDTKATVELILKNLYLSSENSWRIINLRYFNPIGAHSSGLIGEDPLENPNNLFPYICRVAVGNYKNLKIFGNNWPTKDGTGIRDYIHVMDLAEAHKCALEFLFKNKPQYKSINIGTGKGTSVLELVNTFQKVNKCNIPFVFENRREGDSPFSVANNSQALSLFSWKPIRGLEEMCRDGWRWQKNNPYGFNDLK